MKKILLWSLLVFILEGCSTGAKKIESDPVPKGDTTFEKIKVPKGTGYMITSLDHPSVFKQAYNLCPSGYRVLSSTLGPETGKSHLFIYCKKGRSSKAKKSRKKKKEKSDDLIIE